MRVSKEIAEKVDEYERLKKQEEQIYEELIAWANENGFEDFCVEGFGVAKEPVGEEQTDGEYCDQTMYGEDTGYGTYIIRLKAVHSICGLGIHFRRHSWNLAEKRWKEKKSYAIHAKEAVTLVMQRCRTTMEV